MTAPADAYVEAAIRRFDEGLNRAGFRTLICGDAPGDWEWCGTAGREREPAIVTIDGDFPFVPPRVVLPQRADQIDWHQMPDGVLCLWDSHSQGSQPWLDGQGLVDRIEEWVAEAEAGWANDMPQLDLEAYNNLWGLDPWRWTRGWWLRGGCQRSGQGGLVDEGRLVAAG